MHSKLLTRILVVACIIVMGSLSVLGGTTLRFSDEAWNQIVEAIASSLWNISSDVSLYVDAYDSLTEEVAIQLTGSASSANGAVEVTCYRTDDLGRIIETSEAGEMGALQSQYAVEIDANGHFSTPELHLKDGENHFVIVATDISGLSAVEIVDISYRMGTVQGIDATHMATTDTGVIYQNNLITLTFKPGTTPERAREIIAEIGGTEVGNIAVLRRYQVQVPAASYEDLTAQCDQYEATYTELSLAAPELINRLSTNSEGGSDANTYEIPNDPWSVDGTTQNWDESYPSGNNWNLECIQALSAWEYKPFFRDFTVGVIDVGFLDGHDDLRLYFGDERRVVDDHGTHIAGTIGALHNNATGLSGVMNKGRLFAYPLNCMLNEDGSFYLNSSEKLYSLVSCVINGSSVVNVSLGYAGEAPAEAIIADAYLMGEAMAILLSEGYDFVITQAAGNGDESGNAIDAINNCWYVSVHTLLLPEMQEIAQLLVDTYSIPVQELSDRVIVVANAVNRTQDTPYFELRNSSNCGPLVEIAAPGTNIYSTVSGGMLGMGSYDYMSGTSMAAPHVAAVAAMAWSTNPDITGADVKEILMENTIYTAVSAADSPMPGYEYPIVNALLAVKAAIDFEREETYADITVVDAATGTALPSASVVITRGVTAGGPLVGNYITDQSGKINLTLESGDYVLDISKEGFIGQPAAAMHLQPNQVNSSTYALSRELGENEIRIVLTWGDNPSDLDSHLIGYLPGTNTPFRVFWSSKVSDEAMIPFANLDVDDTSSYGPETITISSLPDRPLLYCVHDYTNKGNGNSMEMSRSNATIQVMRHTDVIATYTVSPNRQSVEWVLFWLMPDGSIVDVNSYGTGPRLPTEVGIDVFQRGIQ